MSSEIVRQWSDIAPADAMDINLTGDLTITAPLNENGERCPWPWEPQQLVGAPVGQYRCSYCQAMVVAGVLHLDYAPEEGVLPGHQDGHDGGADTGPGITVRRRKQEAVQR